MNLKTLHYRIMGHFYLNFYILLSTYHKFGLSFIVLAAIIILRSGEQFLSRGGRAIHRPCIALILRNGFLGAATGILVVTTRSGLLVTTARSILVMIRGGFVGAATGNLVVAIRSGFLGIKTLILVIAIHYSVVRFILVVLHTDIIEFFLLIDPRYGLLAD